MDARRERPGSDFLMRPALGRRLNGNRRLTRSFMVVERLWPVAIGLFSVAALFFALSWFGVFAALPVWGRRGLLALLGIALIVSFLPLRKFRWPSRQEADRRLEDENALSHQAVSVQSDQLAVDDAFAAALWDAHRRRMAARIGNLDSGTPRPDTPRRDPFGFRALAALLLFVAFAYSYSDRSGTLADAFSAVSGEAPAPLRVDAWVTPPAYTGTAPIFLKDRSGSSGEIIAVPENSQVVVRLSSGSGREQIIFANADGTIRELDADGPGAAPEGGQSEAVTEPVHGAARSFQTVLTGDGALQVPTGNGPLEWQFSVIPDAAPAIRFAQDPSAALKGALQLSYEMEDDYGVTAARAVIALAEPLEVDARPLYDAPDLPLALPRRGSTSGKASTERDLTDHPYAGKEVTITLEAEDAAGHIATSEPFSMTMPERGFYDFLARAVVEHRQILSLDANDTDRVLDLIDIVTAFPEETFESTSHYLLLRSARARVAQAFNDDMLRDAADYLWEIALGIEDGDLSLAERRLRDAQRELSEALEEGADEERIAELMEELREAMQEFMQALAEEAARNPEQAMQMPENMQELSRRDLDEMLDRIEELAKSGMEDEARQLLSELQRMMNNLQTGQQPQQNAGQPNQMQEQMNELGELMQRQQELMNETFRNNRELQKRRQFGDQSRQQPPPGEPGQQGENGEQGQPDMESMTEEQLRQALDELREQQEALQERLEALQGELEGMGMEPSEGFGEAGEAMGDAAGNLGQGEGEQALGNQGKALEALRQGAQQMMNQMMQAMQGQNGQNGQGPPGTRQGNAGRDPLGRPRATDGPDFGDDVEIPDEIDVQRAREILNAIRDRLGRALTPEMEKNYLERLLDLR